MENIVRIENLIFEYAGDENKEPLRAIKGISLDIEAGTFTAIIGRNGSGKSTLAKCLNGLLFDAVPSDLRLGIIEQSQSRHVQHSFSGADHDNGPIAKL